jgi:hypothetical protein
MQIPNAFVGHTEQPSDKEVAAVLGPNAELWDQVIGLLATQGAAEQAWKSGSPKYGWSLRLKTHGRTIIYLTPCNGCFRASFVLGDRAVAAAHQGNLPKRVVKAIDEAPRFSEGLECAFWSQAKGTCPEFANLRPSRWLIDSSMCNCKHPGLAAG